MYHDAVFFFLLSFLPSFFSREGECSIFVRGWHGYILPCNRYYIDAIILIEADLAHGVYWMLLFFFIALSLSSSSLFRRSICCSLSLFSLMYILCIIENCRQEQTNSENADVLFTDDKNELKVVPNGMAEKWKDQNY